MKSEKKHKIRILEHWDAPSHAESKNVEFTEMVVVDVVAGSLQIRHSLESDEGKYECMAENSVGVAYSYGANLYVRGTRWHCFSILAYMRLNN